MHSAYISAFKKLLLTRLAEQQIQKEYFDDEMKTPVHLAIGAEAIAAGVISVMPKDFQCFGTYRNHGIYLSITEDTCSFFGELYGKINGCAKGKAGSMHMSAPEKGLIATSAVVATTIPVAVGAALGNKIMGRDKTAVTFFGDGAVEEGVFWESLNFACLRNLPILFVCEDNNLAIHSHGEHRQGFKSFGDVVNGYKCIFEQADGTDLEAVIRTTEKVLQQMRETNQPGVLHFDYFRFLEHVGPLEDFKFGYRAKPQDVIENYDPVVKAEKYLLANGVTQETLNGWREEMLAKIADSVAKAKAAPFPSPKELLTDVWAETPRYH